MEESFNQLYQRYNTDDVFNRVVIIGLLDLLNNKIKYNQIWDDNIVEEVSVPFMYDFGSSDERFAQDNYAFFGTTCFNEKKITGKFDMLPRGAIKYTGSSIDASNITNRFVKGSFLKNENGRLTSYTGDMYSIPVTFNFECEMWIDNILTAFKIEQAIREAFYKNKTYYVLYSGMKLACCAGFPEQSTLEKTTTYAFDQERQLKINFSLAVEAYQPIFDLSTVIESSKHIESFALDVEMPKNISGIKRKITIIDTFQNCIFPVNTTIPIHWHKESDTAEMLSVNISYIDVSTNTEHFVKTIPFNNMQFDFMVPETLKTVEQPVIVIDDISEVLSEPEIKLVPIDGEITFESFYIINPGFFRPENGTLQITIEQTNDDNTLTLSDSYSLNIIDHIIDIYHPVNITGETMKFNIDTKANNIIIKVSDSMDTNVFDCTEVIQII